jgi:prolyl-tRNA synthetase
MHWPLKIYEELAATGVEVILDDRDERPGVKFKDADLVGFPISPPGGIGEKSLAKGEVRNQRPGSMKIFFTPLLVAMSISRAK